MSVKTLWNRPCLSFLVGSFLALASLNNGRELVAQTVDTLTSYNAKSSNRWYRIPGLITQAERFEVKTAGEVREVRVLLGGKTSEGSARVRLFGFEGGGPAPFLEQQLTEPLIVNKSKVGLEWVTVALPRPIRIDQRQFFVAVDRLSEGTFLVTDSEIKPVCCIDGDETWHYQSLKKEDGRWWSGKYGFGIEAIVHYDREPALRWLSDATASSGILDTSLVRGGISWADINSDSYLDLLVNGRLYKNRGGKTFVDVTEASGLRGIPSAGLFVDVDNDERVDIIFLGEADSASRGSSSLFRAVGDGTFRRHDLAIDPILNPTSVSIADADLNGTLDLFVGQGRDEQGGALPDMLLLNDGAGVFSNRTDLLRPTGEEDLVSQGSQWVDVDGNGFLDLYIVNQGRNASELWRSNGDGTYTLLYGPGVDAPAALASVNTIGGSWADADADGTPDLLAPQYVSIRSLSGKVDGVRSIGMSDPTLGTPDFAHDHGIPFSEKRGSGVWADVDNSGLLDLLVASASPCRNADLYLQEANGSFSPVTAEYGLLHLPAGPDAVWVDYDDDGLLDLATLVNGRFRLYRNTKTSTNAWASIEIDGGDATGMTVALHAGERTITRAVTSGRGLLMQDPLRLHFGLGDIDWIDSVTIMVPGGARVHFGEIPIDRITKLRLDRGSTAPTGLLSAVSAFPNPFGESVSISFSLRDKAHVVIDIVDLDGVTVARALDETHVAGTHTVTWRGVDAHGERLPQGTYVYHVRAGPDVFIGRVIHRR